MQNLIKLSNRLINTSLLILVCVSNNASAQQVTPLDIDKPISIVLGGYGPPSSSFSQGLTLIGDRLQAKFGEQVEVHYVYNVLELGYEAANSLVELVQKDILTLGYLSMSTDVPALEIAALPFLFSDTDSVRKAMDGELGQSAIESIEKNTGLRVLGFYENGFRHISNSVRAVHTPADLDGLKIRVLAIQKEPLELLGAAPIVTRLTEVIPGLESGELEGQENPFENVITYSMYKSQKYYTKTYHSYMSRPMFVNPDVFDAWPKALQAEFTVALKDAVVLQRKLHDQAEIDSEVVIRESGGEIVDLTSEQRQLFVDGVAPIYAQAKEKYSQDLLDMVGL